MTQSMGDYGDDEPAPRGPVDDRRDDGFDSQAADVGDGAEPGPDDAPAEGHGQAPGQDGAAGEGVRRRRRRRRRGRGGSGVNPEAGNTGAPDGSDEQLPAALPPPERRDNGPRDGGHRDRAPRDPGPRNASRRDGGRRDGGSQSRPPAGQPREATPPRAPARAPAQAPAPTAPSDGVKPVRPLYFNRRKLNASEINKRPKPE